MKTRIQTLNDYTENTGVSFANHGQALDLLTKRDSDIADFLIEMFNEYSRLSETTPKETDKRMFQHKKEVVGSILQELHLAL